jgi:head-tail adaptor
MSASPWFCQSSVDRFTTAFMVDTFKVQSFSLTANNSGGQTETWTDTATGIPGFMEASKYRSGEPLHGDHQQEERRWAITLRQGTVVNASMRLVQTHSNGTALTTQRTFKILSVIDGESFDMGVDCECVETPNLS